MRLFLAVFAFVLSVPVAAQEAPFAVSPGERVRVVLAPTPGVPGGAAFVGRVRSVGADSLSFEGDGARSAETLAWSGIAAVERRVQNRTGEGLGLLAGGIVGGLVGYVLGGVLTDDPLGRVAAIPGSIVGLLVGGVVGAHVGDRWKGIPPSAPALGVRAAVPLR